MACSNTHRNPSGQQPRAAYPSSSALRNGQYGILKVFAKLKDPPGVPGLDIPDIDIVSLAKGYGCEAERITDLEILKARVKAGFACTGPVILEVPLSPTIPLLI
ncbi:MAG: thiamine pyrophosphate-dependent enzyme [Xanthobacter sp.]